MFYRSISFFIAISVTNSWNLKENGLNSDYYTSGIAIYRNRAFLAIPRSVCNKNVTKPTIVEVLWSEDAFSIPNFLDPFGLRKKPVMKQKWGNCKEIQDAIDLNIEPRKPNLWVLDKGNDICPPKLVSYSLFLNSVTQSCDFSGIPRENLNTLAIDPHFSDHGVKAFIGDVGENALLVVSLQDLKWWRLTLLDRNEPYMAISTSFLAISKTLPFLYMTGWNATEVFEMDLEGIRSSDGPSVVKAKKTFIKANVTYLGNQLGISRGLETDYKRGLSYYMVRDYAIARWQVEKPFVAEYHSILAQSYVKLPYVSQLFTGPQFSLWALVNPVNPDVCENFKGSFGLKEDKPNVTHRVVKLLKYNRFFV